MLPNPVVGDSRTYTANFTDGVPTLTFPLGTPKDPTTITYRVRDPLGVETSFVYPATIVKLSTGVYYLIVTFTVNGTWTIRAEGAGAVIAAYEWKRTVSPSAFRSVMG